MHALQSPEHCNEKDMQFDGVEIIMHDHDLRYQTFTQIVIKNNFGSSAVTGDEISFQILCNEKTFRELLLHLKWQVQPSNNTLTIFETVALDGLSRLPGTDYAFLETSTNIYDSTIPQERRSNGVHCKISMCTN